jgi:hypothetical protein
LQALSSPLFSAFPSASRLETRFVIGDFQHVTKYGRRNFFVECAKQRMLPFDTVVEKILTFRFSGAAGQVQIFAVAGYLLRFPQLWKCLWKT